MTKKPTQSGQTDPELGHPVEVGAHWHTWLRNGALVVVLLGMLWLVFHIDVPTTTQIRAAIGGWGGAAWVAFILLYAIVAVTPIPVTIVAVTGGVLFGIIEGSILSIIGALLGSWAAYWLARGLGKATVTKLLGRHAEPVEQRLKQSGVQSVYLLRLMPGLPYWPVNYGCGAFGVSQRDFLIGSGVSTIPGQVSLVAIGAFIAAPSTLTGVVIVVAWVVVITMTFFAFRNLRKASRPQNREQSLGASI